ncbi:MAG: aminotransferase class V-fold PLP-dependent enzyme [Cyclobacteriaceae bacterium]|nr:alanine--glyoxylate aminotransferase family protein [Cyclobacteriaceae bacterium]MCH8516622.1 aminotransferase class V-fold PLP-dependent enzyme [Cyclobacteriaceae bacterium]
MINLYPGPSEVYPFLAQEATTLIQDGLVTRNHRSALAMQMISELKSLLHDKLDIPKATHHIAFISSATEGWEVGLQALGEHQSAHIYHGAFGKKWKKYAENISQSIIDLPLEQDEPLPLLDLGEPDMICLTHCETSMGCLLPSAHIEKLAKLNPNSLIGLDATSSMGGMSIPWHAIDYGFASVQKCLGCPPGLAVLVYSQRMLDRATPTTYYNDLLSIHKNSIKNQTHYTPNLLGLGLLKSVMQHVASINVIEQKLKERAEKIRAVIFEVGMRIIDVAPHYQSDTVIGVNTPLDPNEIIAKAEKAGIILGKGYGKWIDSSFRIANFPAQSDENIDRFLRFMRNLTL